MAKMAKITIRKKSSAADENFEREVFERMPEWCKTLLGLLPKYKHLNKSGSYKIEGK